MPRSVNQAFEDFHSRLTPSAGDTEAATAHRQSIYECIDSNFGVLRFFRSGSFGSGTSIIGYSDVDYFASVPTKSLKKKSDATLRQFKEAFDTRFPRTGVYVDSPAVVLPFGTLKKETTEVVPADYIKKSEDGYSIYDIADRSGGWMRSSPEAHNAYVTQVNKDLNFKVKPLIRFLKAWKYYRSVPISSFYLEMRVAKYASQEKSIVYDIDVKRVFQLLYDNDLASLQDPTGTSGYIVACHTQSQRDDALSKLETALSRATKARDAASKEDPKTAIEWWDLLYNNNFPGYYY